MIAGGTRQNERVTDTPGKLPHSQTLSRGIRMLEVLADSVRSPSISELATAIGVHRSIAYRILRTLEDHGLVARDAAGLVHLAAKMATLARGVSRDLQSTAVPALRDAANELAMTAFLVILDRAECVTLASIEPRAGLATVAQHPGTRHSLVVGAPGIAIQSMLSDAALVELAVPRRPEAVGIGLTGFASSHDEVISGLRSIAVPLAAAGHPPAALAVVYVATDLTPEMIAARLLRARETITNALP